jgi:malonate-semialdehyde dehydrogenase (acetylating) / methylmalonate-semialdehyde dehydrogenase
MACDFNNEKATGHVPLTALIRKNMVRLAASITLEQDKTFADAKGDVIRDLQVCETA